ncbi:phosphoribosylglycinamide formyltransferase [Enterococcus dongliensis]|uniref:Phosphoribosylglycinamide formyltransferase n=1 Tax=Enterococcus dongliensis TaxID=2559925 RepID=A0AAP5U0R3_9ENTE|nr:phosphoribosylglycinamide formyltransferase [Enterococcus dongliensis]MDT2595911.1 phosphoribosylglycinamide formyltransferase [Enterococcus dongliensis]MDT2602828.1 phosphoribosylglycinamide formyltransferase [Enterococcus dongliensis]MDT2612288.1 phosphoribosylglycinamide formyltransferase [Enterococcus dongliensis]MDT2633978.1 phosphoribosylglycinamide formyltransferase [Enterococcus dongliensis]MDT2637260.1 phosphoribosylglycinamide formyltransferase [Enterococcus dongliensis]
MRIAILASGNGSNFEAIAQAVKEKKIAAEIVLLFSDHRDAYVLKRGEKFAISCESFELKEFPNKKKYETALLELLNQYRVDLVVLAGYMRIIGKELLAAYPKRIINIHPALLPDFPGLHGIKDAYEAGVSETGVTIHYVDSGVDTGPIIAQKKVSIEKNDHLADLETKIHQLEHQLYPEILAKIVNEQ